VVQGFLLGRLSDENMKVIFLDIDGVINNWIYLDNLFDKTKDHSVYRSISGFDPGSIKIVKDIQKEFDAKIVLSSTWRNLEDGYKAVKTVFDIWDKTPCIRVKGYKGRYFHFSEYIPRYYEIHSWFDEHPEVTNFVILDDDPDASDEKLKKHHILINEEHGLQEVDIPKIKETLKIERENH